MLQLQQDLEKFEAKGVKVIVICPENKESIEKFLQKEPSLTLDFISDNDHMLADEYGQQVKILKLGRMPAQIIIDQNDDEVFEHFSNGMSDIIENDEILSKF